MERFSSARRRYVTRLAAPVVLVLALALVLMTASASANTNTASIAFAGNATLLFSPGPVNVTLHYNCPSPSPGVLQAEVIQNAESGVSPVEPATCNGKNQSVTLTIDGLFVPGAARGIAVVQSGGSPVTGIGVADQQIMIK